MNIIKPALLKKGDTIGILATSGNLSDSLKLNSAVKFFQNNGYQVKISNNTYSNYRYMAGSDYERVNALHDMFSDSSVNAIIALRGGYGALRLIDKIDYNLIKNNPKIFCGYSDVTILNVMLLKYSNLMTYSGPMILSDFGEDDVCSYTMDSFFNTLTSNKSEFCKFYKGKRFWGGNLSSLISLCGIDFVPDFRFDLFIEDLNEPVYKIDKMLRQLFNIKKMRKNTRTIFIGDFINIDDTKYFDELLNEVSKDLSIPIIKDFPASHSKIKATIPYGITL